MIRRPPRSTLSSSSAASDVYKRQVERHVLFLHHRLGCCRIFVEKFFNNFSLHYGFGHNISYIIFFYTLITTLLRMDNDQRAFFTETETTGRADFHIDILFFYFGFKFFFDFDTAVTATACLLYTSDAADEE